MNASTERRRCGDRSTRYASIRKRSVRLGWVYPLSEYCLRGSHQAMARSPPCMPLENELVVSTFNSIRSKTSRRRCASATWVRRASTIASRRISLPPARGSSAEAPEGRCRRCGSSGPRSLPARVRRRCAQAHGAAPAPTLPPDTGARPVTRKDSAGVPSVPADATRRASGNDSGT